MGRFVRACPRCLAELTELRCPKHRTVGTWAVMDLRTGELLAAGRCDRIILGPLLASLSASFLEVFERQSALPKPAHPRAA